MRGGRWGQRCGDLVRGAGGMCAWEVEASSLLRVSWMAKGGFSSGADADCSMG